MILAHVDMEKNIKRVVEKTKNVKILVGNIMDKNYTYILNLAKNFVEKEDNFIANCGNISSLIFNNLNNLNWAGFYLYNGEELVLGPFQGLTATTRIKLDSGVCGTAAMKRETQVVPDVHLFPGHIACDLASNSEIRDDRSFI